MRNVSVLIVLLLACVGCAVNPVTGERQFMIVPSAADIKTGEQYYQPMQQSQGGEFVVDPGLTAYVRSVGADLAAQSNVPLPYEFVVLNNSVPNAWALPGGKIAINRGLLTELESEAELAAVLGHEIVHSAARHTAAQQSRGLILQGLVLATAIATSDSDYGTLAVGGASVGAQLVSLRYGREAELESDYYGMQYMAKAGYDPEGAVSLQETFVRLSEGRSANWLSGLFSSHPPSPDRVRANRATAAELPPGGRLGKDTYARALDLTMGAKPAYDAYDEGRKALAEKRMDEALALADRALDLFPAEPHFHALRGDVRLLSKQYQKAETNYTRAIARNEGFFYYHLQRGLARKELGEAAAARTDLERSVALLPTAPAHLALGELAKARGDVTDALGHYKVVAAAGGAYGEAAGNELARLDLPNNPGSYVPRRCNADQDGNLVVSVKNETNLALRGVRVAVLFTGADGQPRRREFPVPGPIAPGQIASVNTGMGPFNPAGQCPAEVVAASVAE